MPTERDYTTETFGGVEWAVRVMPDGRRQRVGRSADLRGTLAALAVDPELTSDAALYAAIEREAAAAQVRYRAQAQEEDVDG
jgi:hypothetical protein